MGFSPKEDYENHFVQEQDFLSAELIPAVRTLKNQLI